MIATLLTLLVGALAGFVACKRFGHCACCDCDCEKCERD
jgi:hypothetical protein